jgi:TonB-linked SusC/RagA family outer membrane protein
MSNLNPCKDMNILNEDGISLHFLTKKRGCVMRITVLLLTLVFFRVSALETDGQNAKETVNMSTSAVKEVLKEIEKQSDYTFFYNDLAFDMNRKVHVNVSNTDVSNVLKSILPDCTFEVTRKRIILIPDTKSVIREGRTINGVVTDVDGEPVIGASVIEKGTTNGVITNPDGQFSMIVGENAVLQISYIGYVTQEIPVHNKQSLTITLTEDTQVLDEVVVVGYGLQKKANLTGAVSSVKMDEVIGERPIVNAAEALQGNVPGLLVSNSGNQAGTGKSFQIRGAYSIGIQNSDGSYGATIAPLVLIDNVEGDLDMINPEDIETISILKDASSSAIYGARAAGGVILVTTKRPKHNTSFQLNYNNNFSFANAVNLPKQAPIRDYLQAVYDSAGDQFWTIGAPSVSKWLEYLDQYQKNPSSLQTYGDGIFKDADGAVYYLNEKDLVKNMLESSFQMTHNLSMSGGTDKLRYRISGGYVDNDGVLITDKDSYERFTFNSYISADITKWLTQEATVNYTHSTQTRPSSALGAIYSTRLASFYPEGEMPEEISVLGAGGYPFITPRNQILWSNPSKNINDNPRIFLKSTLKPFKSFEAVFEYTFDKNVYNDNWYTGSTKYTTVQDGVDTTPTAGNDYLRKQKQHTDYNAINVYGTYDFSLAGGHAFRAMAGFNQESRSQETLDAYSYGQAIVEVPSMAGGTTKITVTDLYDEFSLRGGFFRINYGYKDKYLAEINGRYDGSSKFPHENRFGFFPSGSLGWQVAEESFLSGTRKWLNTFKLRASYGMIGNQNIPNYSYLPTMSINNTYSGWLVNNTYVTAVTSLPALVRNDFTWEKVTTLNLGVDFAFLNNRLSGLFEWYQKDTRGMLAPGIQLPAVVGASAPYQNTADMRTKGWDFNINWKDHIGKVGYRLGLNLSDYKSIVTKYDSNELKLISNFYDGMELGEIWGYVFDGFYSTDDFENTSSWVLKDGVTKLNGYNPRPGDVKFKNLRDDDLGENIIYAGDETLENPGDRKIIGNNLPRYLYGITLGANFAGFDLNIFLQGTGKRDAWLANTLTFPLYSDFRFVSLYEGLGNYWKPVDATNGDYSCANPNAEFPRIYGNYGNQASNYRQSDKYVSDASYLRIKNITFSYTFPRQWMNKIAVRQLRGFVSIENLGTFSSLPKGIDPETLNWNYPAFRTASFGLNFTL